MADPDYVRRHMRGPSAPSRVRSEVEVAERRRVADRLGLLREPARREAPSPVAQVVPAEHAVRAVAPRSRRERRSAPRATRMDPTISPLPTDRESVLAERRRVADRLGLPPERPTSTEPASPPVGLERRSSPPAARMDSSSTPPQARHPPLGQILHEEARSTAPHDRSAERNPALDAIRRLRGEPPTPRDEQQHREALDALLSEPASRPMSDRDRRVRDIVRGAPHLSPERPMLLEPPHRFFERAGEAWDRVLQEHPDAPPIGVVEGIRRLLMSLPEAAAALADLAGALTQAPGAVFNWIQSFTPEEHEDLGHLLRLDREGVALISEILRSQLDNPELLQALVDVVMTPFDAVAEHFVRGWREAEDMHGTEAAAQIVQGTGGLLELISAVEGMVQAVRGLGRFVPRVTRFRSRLSDAIERARRALGRRRPRPRPGDHLPPHLRGSRARERVALSATRLREFRDAVRARRRSFPYRINVERFLRPYELAPVRRSSIPTDTFREWALDHISADPNHPLWSLVDLDRGNFRRPAGSGHRGGITLEDHLEDLTVEMGHLLSRGARQEERLALQWSWSNQAQGRYTESIGGQLIQREAVDIGGIPVELNTARLMEEEGLLLPGTVARARPHPGFLTEEWLVAPGATPGELVWRRSP